MDDSTPGQARDAAGPNAVAERMQALLSQAAEAQVTEQREVSAALRALHLQMAGVSEQLHGLATLPEALRRLQREVAGLHDRLAALAAEQAQAEQRLRTPAARVTDAVPGVAPAPAASGAHTRPDPPVRPLPEVSARFAAASNAFGPPSDDAGPPRRAWWRPGS